MQSLWQQKYNWDIPLPGDLQRKWAQLANDLNTVSEDTSYSRCYFENNHAKGQNDQVLHIFVDASIHSYGAVAYLCNGNRSAIMMAKNRVVPLKTITLPKLELMAAVVGARLASHLEKSLAPKNVTFLSDSQIVLHWLQSTKPLKRFHANGVKEIQEITHDRKWMFCPTAYNPAILTGVHSVVDITHYSRYTKLIRVTAFILRFVNNCRRPHTRKLSRLSVHELHEAEKMWLRSCQSTSYHEEIDNLQSKKGRLPMVKQLRLFLDSDGYIRCGGRIHNAPVAELVKFPYRLPGNHHLTRMIIQNTHERLLHAGISATVTQLRQKYWIASIHQNTKIVLRKCETCRKVIGKPYTIPDPPPLPTYRLHD